MTGSLLAKMQKGTLQGHVMTPAVLLSEIKWIHPLRGKTCINTLNVNDIAVFGFVESIYQICSPPTWQTSTFKRLETMYTYGPRGGTIKRLVLLLKKKKKKKGGGGGGEKKKKKKEIVTKSEAKFKVPKQVYRYNTRSVME